MSQVKEFCEEWRGLHGGNYYYVLDNGCCNHIARYATKSVRDGDRVCYYVDESKIANKVVFEIVSSKSGSIYVEPNVELVNRCIDLPHLTDPERRFVEEWHKYYIPMLEFIKGTAVRSIGVSNMLESHLKYLPKYPFPFFIPYSSDARLKPFVVLTREIHEIYIALIILKEFVKDMDFVDFRQSSVLPVADIGNYSLWYQLDFTPNTMCRGILRNYCGSFDVSKCKEHLPQWLLQIYSQICTVLGKSPDQLQGLRPDIMFTQAVSSCHDLFESSTIEIKLIIECKNFDYAYWAKDVNMQIKPYKEIFQPEHMIVASLKPVPQYVKNELKSWGIEVIDNVYPGGGGEEQLVKYVKQVLGFT